MGPRRHTSRHIMIISPKIKDKGRILKAARGKETDFKEAQGVPKKLDPRKHTPRHIIITLSKIQGEILKSSKRKGDSYLQRSSH